MIASVVSIKLKYLMPAYLSRIPFRFLPLYTGEINTLLSLAGAIPYHLFLVLKTILDNCDVSSTSKGTIIYCLCKHSNSSFSGSWSAYATLLGR